MTDQPVNSLLKYRKSAALGHAAYTIPCEITHFVGPVTPPGEFLNALLGAVWQETMVIVG